MPNSVVVDVSYRNSCAGGAERLRCGKPDAARRARDGDDRAIQAVQFSQLPSNVNAERTARRVTSS